jgi:hypothetical protein
MKGPRRRPPDTSDVSDVFREEAHRGRRGVLDIQARRERQRLEAAYLKALEGSLTDFCDAIAALHEEGTPEYDALIRIWHEKHGRPVPRKP